MSAGSTAESTLKVPGVRLGATGAGIKRTDRDDLLVIELAAGGTMAAVFTRNAFCAAPVTVAREHLGQAPRWLLINSGNANAGTGARGLDDARDSCRRLAALVDGAETQVLPFSTGVIGEYLPLDKITTALPDAVVALDELGWERAARAIMTTDTRPKIASRELDVGGRSVRLAGIAKGAGMIHPDMATMLSFVATDAAVEEVALQQLLNEAVDRSFNCITVDGDTSTNDACVLMASGHSAALAPGAPGWESFRQAVLEVCSELAEAIIRDGEGATKLIRIAVEGACDRAEALAVGKTIAHSPLVKTAFFASDPNWGRILAAIGRAGCPELDIGGVTVSLGEVVIVEGGGRAAGYTEAAGQVEMAKPEITVGVRLGRGGASAEVLTCDFSYDYVRINAEYRT